jgi:iron-sulfur cluster assembly protein CyaY
MLDDQEFRSSAASAIDALKGHLKSREDEGGAGFEVERQNDALQILFEEQGGKFVVTPNMPARQIWISALATSFKLDWDSAAHDFIFPRTGEALIPLVERLIEECVQG